MAGAANFHMGGFRGGAGSYLVSAGAGDNRAGIILGMDFFFHNIIYNTKTKLLQINNKNLLEILMIPRRFANKVR